MRHLDPDEQMRRLGESLAIRLDAMKANGLDEPTAEEVLALNPPAMDLIVHLDLFRDDLLSRRAALVGAIPPMPLASMSAEALRMARDLAVRRIDMLASDLENLRVVLKKYFTIATEGSTP